VRAQPILLICAILAVLLFGIDVTLELGIAAGVLYVAVVLLARLASDARVVLGVAVGCTGLAVLGFFLSPSGPETSMGLVNRALVVAALWITATVVYFWKRSEASALEEAGYFKLLQAATEAANVEPTAEHALEAGLGLVCAHTGWPVGHVYLPAKDGTGHLEPTATWHMSDPDRFATFRRVTEQTRFPPGVGLPGRVLAMGRPAWISDVTRDPNFPRAAQAEDIGVRGAFAFPILIGTEVAAVLEFFSDRTEPSNPRMLEVMGQIGIQLGRAVERGRAEAAGRRSGERYRHIFESAPVSIWEEDLSELRAAFDVLRAEGVTDFEGYLGDHPEFVRDAARMIRVLDVNAAALSMIGVRDKRRLLGGLDRIYDPASHDVFKAELAAIAAGRTHFEIESVNRDARGERLDSHVSLAIPAADSGLNLLVCVADITARKRAEAERAAFEGRIQHTQRLESLGVLAGGIAHDFNNLLAVILGNCRIALESVGEGSPIHPMLTTVRSAAQHAAALTQQLLTYAGRGTAVREPLDVSLLVDEMRELLQTTVEGECDLETLLTPDLAPVAGDPVQLRQVVLNLVTNAREALSGPGGTVTVRTHESHFDAEVLSEAFGNEALEPGRYVVLEVSDPGVGIARETQARIFDPFFTTKFSGRGLGLAALLGIVRGHGGAILIESDVGAGTTFRVILPRASAIEARPAPSEAQASSPSRPARVLVVDDDEDMLALTGLLLERAGFRVLLARGGQAALEAFEAADAGIDVVVLDWAMPDMSGEETLIALRRRRESVPVILMSGFSEEKAVARLARRELAGFLHKPFEPEELAASVRSALSVSDAMPPPIA
jgi:signal transduction histidine kinase/ActR/RegA family two-component response regulator/GAF domain-containing protein